MTYVSMYASKWHHMTHVIIDMFTMDMYICMEIALNISDYRPISVSPAPSKLL